MVSMVDIATRRGDFTARKVLFLNNPKAVWKKLTDFKYWASTTSGSSASSLESAAVWGLMSVYPALAIVGVGSVFLIDNNGQAHDIPNNLKNLAVDAYNYAGEKVVEAGQVIEGATRTIDRWANIVDKGSGALIKTAMSINTIAVIVGAGIIAWWFIKREK